MRGINRLANELRVSAILQAADGRPVSGIVTSYDPTNFCAKVKLQPSEIETGWLPIRTAQIGAGFGVYAAPNIGDQVDVEFTGDDIESGRVVGGIPSSVDQPPSLKAGEILIAHSSGSSLLFSADGKITMVAPQGFYVTGKITATDLIKSLIDVFAAAISLLHHKHGGVQTGAGVSGEPQ